MFGRCWTAAAVGLIAWSAVGTSDAAEYDPAALKTIVEKSAERFIEAYAKHDAAALGALFTEDAEYVDSSGVVFHGRESIEAEYEANFQVARPGVLALDVVSIRPLAENLIVEDGVSTFYPENDGPASEMKYTVTHLKQADGSWLMASVRELSEPVVSIHDRLKALAWLEGKWREELDDQVVATEWKWSEDGNFLLAGYSVRNAQGVVLEGTHRIGWDGERKQFRSWIFDSEGGASDGWWTQGEENAWSVQLSGVDSQGRRRSMLLTYVREGDDAIVIGQEDRRIGDDALPDSAHRVVRQAPEPGQ
ncbi:MAG TPA: SgcJ/EcaC family oxidoreductase [Pirellulales bacterium]